MAKTNSLLAKVVADFPELQFKPSDDFYWSPSTNTIYLGPVRSPADELTLLHETAHALLAHKAFTRDIDLLKIEREAWDYTTNELASRYGVAVDDEEVENMLDTYREWLHARSTCPQCSLTGVQTGDAQYRCLGCGHEWRVNDARRCGLRRYAIEGR